MAEKGYPQLFRKMNPRFYILILAIFFSACQQDKTLKVLQFNIWQEGTIVEDGLNGIVENIINTDPDLITFSEVRNYDNVQFIPRLIAELEKRGVIYYGEPSVSTGILSKYKIEKQDIIYPLSSDHGSVLKATIPVDGKTIILYSAHLDYTRYACYLPRGYSGTTWEKLDKPILDPDSVQKVNKESLRDEAIKEVINDARQEKDKGNIILIGGDFNEPSHLDWGEDTKDMRDHNGTVVRWDCSVLLNDNGFKDAYREIYPDPIANPGFTFPSDNEQMEVNKLTWAPDADERDRIDFIYFMPDKRLIPNNASVVGPSKSIIRGKRVEDDSQDQFILPKGIWPTDHKAVLVTFKLITP